ncbi:hypothetical protein CTI14_67850, partial [Methylobacterium radiotolerans]
AARGTPTGFSARTPNIGNLKIREEHELREAPDQRWRRRSASTARAQMTAARGTPTGFSARTPNIGNLKIREEHELREAPD